MSKRNEVIEAIFAAVRDTPASWTQEKIEWDDDGEENWDNPVRSSLGEYLSNTHLEDMADEIIRDAARIALDAALSILESPSDEMLEAYSDLCSPGGDLMPAPCGFEPDRMPLHRDVTYAWKAMLNTLKAPA